MKSHPISPDLLQKYLHGTCTDQEKEWVEAWYRELDKSGDIPDEVAEEDKEELLDEAFRWISDQIDQEEAPRSQSRFPWSLALGIAASLLFVLGVFFIRDEPARQESSAVTALPADTASALVRFLNGEPRIVQHRLPDGSIVWLHPQAQVSYPKAFGPQNRTVDFEGEGFFDIRKDPVRPFFIHSGEMTVRVLGTSFNVKAPSDQKLFEIAVVTGSVQVTVPDSASNPQQLVLKPNQQAFFQTQTRKLFAKEGETLLKAPIYQPHSFRFEDTSVGEVVRQLESQFAVRIQLSDAALADCRLNADFENQSFPAIIEMLCQSLESTYTIQGTTILIKGEPCQ